MIYYSKNFINSSDTNFENKFIVLINLMFQLVQIFKNNYCIFFKLEEQFDSYKISIRQFQKKAKE